MNVQELLRIYMNDTSKFSLNDKITISGITEKDQTLRTYVIDDNGSIVKYFSVTNGLQYMSVNADTNMTINTNITATTQDASVDAKVEFRGFIGDKITQWYFDTRLFKWDVTRSFTSDNKPTKVIRIEEDVYAVTEATSGLPEEKQEVEYLLIAEFETDIYGSVINITSDVPYSTDNLRWTTPVGFPSRPVQLVPSSFTIDAGDALIKAKLNTPPALPATIYNVMDYFERVQNVIRPIMFNLIGSPNTNFDLRYQTKKRSYPTIIRLLDLVPTTFTTSTMIGNISLNMLNTTHRMYITSIDVEQDLNIDMSNSIATDTPEQNKFYIKLTYPYSKRPMEIEDPMMTGAMLIRIYEETKSDVTIRYKHYGGVPTNTINADLPIGFKSIVGYKYIKEIVKNSYIVVDLDRIGFFDKRFGGACVYIGGVYDVLTGYPNPNNYVIELDQVYTNIVMVRMIASCFPKSQSVFMDGVSGGNKNNRFYWQNADDGSIVYKIELDTGNYSPNKLKSIFESAVSTIPRVGTNIQGNEFNYITLDIDSDSNKAVFRAYNIYKPSTSVLVKKISLGEINQNSLSSSSSVALEDQDLFYKYPSGGYYKTKNKRNILSALFGTVRIKIAHPNNTVQIGQQILINGSTNYEDIHSSYINGYHIVTRVDNNSYDILLFNVNLDSTLDMTSAGGNAIQIYAPTLFRILYNYADTFGKELGFRNVGAETSITSYDYVITNDVLYDGEDLTTAIQYATNVSTANAYSISNIIDGVIPLRNSIMLSGTPYIFITCNELRNCKSIGSVKDYFYRIDLNSPDMHNEINKYIYNSFVDTPMILNDPIKQLTTLTISIVSPDNSYYDFNGLDHSFNLEIVTFDEIPEATSII